MSNNHKYYLIPKGVDLASLKNESDKKNIVKHMSATCTLLIHQFCYQVERQDGSETDKEERDLFNVEIPSSTLKKKVNSRYPHAIKKLTDAGIIKCNDSYLAGEYSKSYTFSNLSHFSQLSFVPNLNYKSPTHDLEEPYKSLSIDFDCDKLTIDENKVHKYISTLNGKPKKVYHIISAKKILMGDYYFTIDKYGRFHHNLTNLSSNLRKFLTYENEKLKGIDLPNAQPLLLLILLNHIKEHKESQYLVDPSEVLKAIDENLDQVQLLKELVFDGNFYAFIYHKLQPMNIKDLPETLWGDTPKEVRKIVKLEVLKWINAKRKSNDHYRPYIDEIIEHHFKPLHTLMWTIKSLENTPDAELTKDGNTLFKASYKNAARVLQSMESDIIIKGICNQLKDEKPSIPLFTIHDCIYTNESNFEYLYSFSNQYIKDNYNINITFNKE